MASVAVQLGRSAARGSATTAVPAPPQASCLRLLLARHALVPGMRPGHCSPSRHRGARVSRRQSRRLPPAMGLALQAALEPEQPLSLTLTLTTILSLNLILIQPGGARGRAAGATRRERYAAE